MSRKLMGTMAAAAIALLVGSLNSADAGRLFFRSYTAGGDCCAAKTTCCKTRRVRCRRVRHTCCNTQTTCCTPKPTCCNPKPACCTPAGGGHDEAAPKAEDAPAPPPAKDAPKPKAETKA